MKASKRLLAVIMTAVLAFGMTVPGFAAYGEDMGVYTAAGITFTPVNFPSEAAASVGDSIIFSMDVTVTTPGALAAAAPSNMDASFGGDIILVWYQDGQPRKDMGHTELRMENGEWSIVGDGFNSQFSSLNSQFTMELRFDTVWATDGGVWTLRAFYDGLRFVESAYSLDLAVAPIGITPFNTVVGNIADLQTAVGSATPTLPVTIYLADNFTGGGTITVPANSTVTINSNVTINNGTNTLTFHLNGGAGTLTTVIWNADITASSGGTGTISLTGNGNFALNGTIRQANPTSSLALRVNGPDVSISSTGLIQNNTTGGTAITILSGRVTLDGGTVQSAGSPAAITTHTGAEGLVVNSGTILNIATGGGAISTVSGTATIHGGTITGGLFQNGGTINMHGGINVVRRSVELSGALTAIGSGTGTIRLGANLTGANQHTSTINISGGANITFDLNGHDLTVTAPAGHGMHVSGAGTEVNVIGTGTMNVGTQGLDIINDGLLVTAGADVNLAVGTTLNVSAANGHGVYVSGATSSATVTNATGGNASGTFVMPAGALAENGGSIIVMGNAITSGNDSVGAEAFGSASTVTVHGNVEGVARGAHANGTGSQVNVTGNATATGAAGDGARANLGGEVNVDGNAISTNDGFGAVANGGGSFVTVEGNASATGGFGIGAAAFANGQVVVRSNVSGELNGSFADNGTVIVEGNVTVTSAGGPGAEVLAGGNIRIDGTITAPIFARVAGANRAQNSFNTPTTLAGYLTYDNRPTTPVTSVWVRDPATPTPPIITNALAPNGTVGTAYNFIFTASGNPTPTWTHSGTLPAGLALSAMGVLSGTPTTVGTFTFTVQASNGVIPNAIEPVTVVVSSPHIPVTSITSVPTTTTAGTALALSGTVAPTIATNNAITWSIVNAGGTGASITGGNTLNTTAAGTVTVRATISDGMLAGVNYTQHFNITVNAGSRTTSSFNTTGATDLPDSTIFAPISVSNATPEGRLEYQVIAAGRHAVLVVTVPANPPGGWPLEGVVTINGHPITVDSTTSWSTFRTDFASALSAANIEMQTGTGGQFLVSAAAGSGQSIILDGNDAILLGALGVGAAPAARANHGSDAEIDITGMFDAANNRIIAADAWTAAAHGNQVTITGAGGVEIRFNLMVRHNPGTPAGSGAAIPPGHTFAGGEPAPVRNPAGALIGSPVDMALHIGPAPAPNLVSITLQGGGTGASISHNQAAANTIITVNAGTRAGYNFNGWTSSPTVTFANANNTSTTFTMPSSAVTVTANWTPQVAYTPNDTGDSDPGPNYGWLSPSSVNFDLANPRNITITFNRGDFTFRNNIRFGNVNLIQGRDFSVEGVRITIWEDFLQTLEVGQRILTIEMSGGANPQLTVNVTDSRPMTATTVLTPAPLLRFDVGSNIFIHNGITLQSDAAPFIDPAYNRVMVPLRLIAEALGAEVEWDEEARRVDIWRIAFVSLTIGEPLPGGMGVPAIVNDRTFVPLRYVAEILGADVYWDSAARAIYIY